MLSVSIEQRIKQLNRWDVYPVVSTVFSGPARMIAGTVQIATGTALTALAALFGWVNGTKIWKQDVVINAQEIVHGAGNVVRGNIASIPLFGNLSIYLYDKYTANAVVLRRDPDGLYTLPRVDVPGFKNAGTIRSRELYVRVGEFVVDTAQGIVPKGWVLKR